MAHQRKVIAVHGCLLAAIAAALAADRDPADVVKRVTAQVIAAGERLPNYTCVETVTREFYRPAASTLPRECSIVLAQRPHPTPDMALRLYSLDRLRLDVTMASRGEMFSWAGASKFDEEGIDHVVREGPMGTGAFGAFLLAVFREGASTSFVRTVAEGGRTLMEYSYRVPLEASKYKVKMTDGWVRTAYSGTFHVDPETSEVVRLVVSTDELPLATGSCMATSRLDFAPVEIGASRFQLPSRMVQRWVSPNGNEAENTTTFSACREYKGESTLTFFAEPNAAAGPAGSLARLPDPLPEGLRLSFALTAQIPTDTAAAGDLFSAALTDPLRDDHGKVVAPKGAPVEGRIIRVESFVNPPQTFVVLRPRTIEIRGVKVPLAAVPDFPRLAQTSGGRRFAIYLPRADEEHAAVFRFTGAHVTVPKGYRTDWRTVAYPEPAAAK
jgi:hypothetical protein